MRKAGAEDESVQGVKEGAQEGTVRLVPQGLTVRPGLVTAGDVKGGFGGLEIVKAVSLLLGQK